MICPHRVPAARIQAGGRLIQEDDAGVPDQRHRQVEAAPHAPGVGEGQFPGRVGQLEAFKQRNGTCLPLTPTQVVQVGHEPQILFAGEQVVHRRELSGDADSRSNRVGLPGQIVPGHLHLPAVGVNQRGQDLHYGSFAGAVGAKQREDRPFRNIQVDAVKHHVVAK